MPRETAVSPPFLRQGQGAAERLLRLRRPALIQDRAAKQVQRDALLDGVFQDCEEVGRFSQRGFGLNQTFLATISPAGAGQKRRSILDPIG